MRGRLAVEMVLLFVGVPVAYRWWFTGASPIPVLLLVGAGALAYVVRTGTFETSRLVRLPAGRSWLRAVAGRFIVVTVVLVVAVLVSEPDGFLRLPRQKPLLWVLIMFLYPVVTVYPQELIYRAFFMNRYERLFGRGAGMLAASAVLFGFAHIIYGNTASVILSASGGWMFASTYRRTESVLAACIEHALYGMMIFTIGLGHLFYHGAGG